MTLPARYVIHRPPAGRQRPMLLANERGARIGGPALAVCGWRETKRQHEMVYAIG